MYPRRRHVRDINNSTLIVYFVCVISPSYLHLFRYGIVFNFSPYQTTTTKTTTTLNFQVNVRVHLLCISISAQHENV